jgi:small-conductance mechanosensitive channel
VANQDIHFDGAHSLMMNRYLIVLLSVFFLLSGSVPVSAQETGAPFENTSADPLFPGLARVAVEASELTGRASETMARLSQYEDTRDLQGRLEQTEARLIQTRERFASQGDPESWNVDRLLEALSQLKSGQSTLNQVMGQVVTRLGALDRMRSDWEARRKFWQQWEEHLASQQSNLPSETFSQSLQTIEQVLSQISDTVAPLVVVQEKLSRLLNEHQTLIGSIESALKKVRGQIFKKTGHSLVSPKFYRQFEPTLVKEVQQGLRQAFRFDMDFISTQGWVSLLQAATVFVIAGFIRRYRRLGEGTAEWRFLLDHPWATGIFVAMAFLGPLYSTVPAAWRLILSTLAVFSATVLIAGIVRHPLKRLIVFLLAGMLIGLMGAQLINLPLPLFRLAVALVALAGLPFCLVAASFCRRSMKERSTLFIFGLRLGALVFLITLLAQITGYSMFAVRLLESSIRSGFVVVGATMALRLGEGAIDFALERPVFARVRFIQRYGRELGRRLKWIFAVLVWVGGGYNLLAVWGIYDSFAQTWDDITGLGLTFGEVHLTLSMVLLAALVIYLSIQASWILRATLETQFFPYRNIDRGVSDSIKKLLHYTLVFVGFLLAMGLAGIELRDFAVLAGAFGIGIGFGLQNIVNNFVSGLILLFERPVKVGDMVVLDGEWGKVGKIGLRSTIIETFDQSELIVPNSRFISEKVTNWTFSNSRSRVVLPVGVAYGSDIALVMKILSEAAVKHELILKDPPPSPIFVGFGNSSLDFELRCWISDIGNRLTVRSDLGCYIDKRFREEGIEIPFPQRDLHLRSVDVNAARDLWQRGNAGGKVDREEKS